MYALQSPYVSTGLCQILSTRPPFRIGPRTTLQGARRTLMRGLQRFSEGHRTAMAPHNLPVFSPVPTEGPLNLPTLLLLYADTSALFRLYAQRLWRRIRMWPVCCCLDFGNSRPYRRRLAVPLRSAIPPSLSPSFSTPSSLCCSLILIDIIYQLHRQNGSHDDPLAALRRWR